MHKAVFIFYVQHSGYYITHNKARAAFT